MKTREERDARHDAAQLLYPGMTVTLEKLESWIETGQPRLQSIVQHVADALLDTRRVATLVTRSQCAQLARKLAVEEGSDGGRALDALADMIELGDFGS